MIDHLTLQVRDYHRAKKFYLKALAPLGYELIKDFPEWNVAGLGAGGVPDLWIHLADKILPMHVAFMVKDKDTVIAYHKAALEAGGKDNGAPGPRPDYGPDYYAAFAFDPDGNNVEVVYHGK